MTDDNYYRYHGIDENTSVKDFVLGQLMKKEIRKVQDLVIKETFKQMELTKNQMVESITDEELISLKKKYDELISLASKISDKGIGSFKLLDVANKIGYRYIIDDCIITLQKDEEKK